MKFYVCGKYSERKQIRIIMDELEKMGHEITCDWTPHTDMNKAEGYAIDDIWGVVDADAVIAIMLNKNDYKGLWVEVGAALGNIIPVYIVGNAGDSCIFVHHPLVKKFPTLFDLYAYLGNKYRRLKWKLANFIK